MSVLITGVNMPSFGEGNELIVRVLPNGAVLDKHGIYLNAKAVHVPPHGQLIDLRTVDLSNGPYEYGEWVNWALNQYLDAPVFMPAEEEA